MKVKAKDSQTGAAARDEKRDKALPDTAMERTLRKAKTLLWQPVEVE